MLIKEYEEVLTFFLWDHALPPYCHTSFQVPCAAFFEPGRKSQELKITHPPPPGQEAHCYQGHSGQSRFLG